MSTVDGEFYPSPTPKPHPRIKPEAESYASRNRGSMEKWFDYSGQDNYQSPRPVGRAVTSEGRKNANVNKGSMSELMGGYADPVVERKIHPRGVKSEGADIAEQSKGGAMKKIIDDYGNISVREPSGPKVIGADAGEYAERNHGVVDNLMNNYGQLTPEAPPPQKLGVGGDAVAEKHQGAGMGPLLRMEGQKTPQEVKQGPLHKTSEGPGWDEAPPQVRTRPEAEQIAVKQGSEVVGHLMRGEVNPPTVRDPKLPLHMQESVTPRPQTSPMRTRPEAMSNYQKNQSSEMSAVLHGQASQATPSRKVNRMMMKSEDW